MTAFFLWRNPEDLEVGPPEPAVECGSAHIGGAESIRLND
jgi:hypothetical protein